MENFKKFISVLVFSVILLTQAGFVLAGSVGVCGACTIPGDCRDSLSCVGGTCQESGQIVFCNPSRFGSLSGLIQAISDWVFKIGIIVAPLMVAVGAFMFVISSGDPNRVSTAKKIILWSVVGLAVLLFSKGIISLIKSFLTG